MQNKSDKTKYQYRKTNFDAIKTEFQKVDWDREFGNDIESNWMVFKELFLSLQEKYVPKVTQGKRGKKRQMWISAEVRDLLRDKKAAYRKYRKDKTEDSNNAYKAIRNKVKRGIIRDKRLFEQKLAYDAKKNPKVFWSYVNSKSKLRQGVCELERLDGTLASDDREKAEVLNAFFASVFTKEDESSIPPVKEHKVDNVVEPMITREQVEKKLKTLNENKSPGPDGMHPYMLKHLAEEVGYPIYLLFKQSIEQGKIPSDWRTANITAVFKKGNRKQPGNYRPVSLTSVICKMMEHFVREAVMGHMSANNLICEEQHGFLKGKTCITNLLESLDSWTESIENKKPLDVAYLDFRKAFDKVPHMRLITKLRMYGIDNRVVLWIEDFLKDRKQRVMVNAEESDWREVSSGIPQGSVLGPCLFIIYINDLPKAVQSETKIFADDTKVYAEVAEGGAERLQDDIDSLQDWSRAWQIEFNRDKCAVVHLGKNNPRHEYYMKSGDDVQVLNKSSGEKDLGVLVDDKLMFSSHIGSVEQKANKVLGVLKRSFKHIPFKEYVMLYKTMVRSKLEYANVVWSPVLERDRDSLERVQKRFTKSITKYKDLVYSDRLKCLDLPTLEYRRIRGDLLQAHKIVTEQDKIKPIFCFGDNSRTRGHDFKMKTRLNYTRVRRNFFSNRIVNHWNKLPQQAVEAKSINVMKNQIDKCFGAEKFVYKNW